MKHFLILILLLFAFAISAAEIIGKVVGVTDGDTIIILDDLDKGRFRIRFSAIDCPEKDQDFGQKAKQYLSSMIFGQTVSVRYTAIDRFGRVLGTVYLNGMDINREILKAGLAWHYKQFDSTKEYADAEEQARRERKGLWIQNNPIPPWDFRRQNK